MKTLTARGATPVEIYEGLAVEDLGRAADLLRPIYDESQGLDGLVSFEVSPHIACSPLPFAIIPVVLPSVATLLVSAHPGLR